MENRAGVWEQPGGVTEVASHTKVRVMGSHAPGNTEGREGGGEEAPSPMDSTAHLAWGSWCCSLLQSLCQRQDTGLAAAISSSNVSSCVCQPVMAVLPWGPSPVPPRSCGTVLSPRAGRATVSATAGTGGTPTEPGECRLHRCCWGGLVPRAPLLHPWE